jgi:hypothetical protein
MPARGQSLPAVWLVFWEKIAGKRHRGGQGRGKRGQKADFKFEISEWQESGDSLVRGREATVNTSWHPASTDTRR